MKQRFEGKLVQGGEAQWPRQWRPVFLFSPSSCGFFQMSSNKAFSLVSHRDYICYEYPFKLNILAFLKWRLEIPVTVIGLPISVCLPGYQGDLKALVKDYKKRKGIFVVLNIMEKHQMPQVAFGRTLSTCIFHNTFGDFEAYLRALRSPYRRRLKKAVLKGKPLRWEKIKPGGFTREMYQLYLQVLYKSEFPLETLTFEFFCKSRCDIYCLFEEEKAVAFIQVYWQGDMLRFVFGGMDYLLRDKYDLYYNMLLKVIEIGMKGGCSLIDFGQTAERSKMRVGCTGEPRYMCVFSRNKALNFLFARLIPFFSYKDIKESYRVFS